MGNQFNAVAEHPAIMPYWAKKVLTFDEAAEYTGLSRSYLYKLTSAGRIPHFKPRAKMLYFNREELEAWLQQGKVKTSEEIEQLAIDHLMSGKKK